MQAQWFALTGASRGARACRKPMCIADRSRARAKLCLPRAAIEFEPTAPGAAQLASMAVVTLSTVITGAFWWLVVVPSERASVSRRKRKGDLRVMLEELEKDETRQAERWFYTDWRNQLQQRKQLNAWGKQQQDAQQQVQQSESEPAGSQHQGSEQQGKEEAQDKPSSNLLEPTYRTPTPRFLSLDNPLVFVFSVLALLVAVTAVTTGRLHV